MMLGDATGLPEVCYSVMRPMRKELIKSFLVLAMGLTPQFRAMAETIYSTLDSVNDFDRTRYTPFNFYTSPEIIGTSLAFAFDVPGTSDYELMGVSIAASWDGTKRNAQFALFADAAGLPTAGPLEVVATNPDSLQPFMGGVISLASPGHPILGAGQRYWLVCQPASLDASSPANDFVELWMNSQGIAGLQTSRVSWNSAPWGEWFAPPFAGDSPAFSIEAVAVPEPITSALLVAAASSWLSLHFSTTLRRRGNQC